MRLDEILRTDKLSTQAAHKVVAFVLRNIMNFETLVEDLVNCMDE